MLILCLKRCFPNFVFLVFTQHLFCSFGNYRIRKLVYSVSIYHQLLFFFFYELECLRNERTMMGSKVYRRQMCMSPVHREVPKTNGHSLSVPTSIAPELHTTLRLGRPLNLKSYGTSRYSSHWVLTKAGWVNICLFFSSLMIIPLSFCVLSLFTGTANSCCTSVYEKTFPIKVVQSPTHSTSSGRAYSVRQRCTAQEVSCEDTATVGVIICLLLLTLSPPPLPCICPVGARRGEGCLPAAPDHGVRWSVVFCTQRQLSRYCEVTQRFVSVNINLYVGAVPFNIILKWST